MVLALLLWSNILTKSKLGCKGLFELTVPEQRRHGNRTHESHHTHGQKQKVQMHACSRACSVSPLYGLQVPNIEDGSAHGGLGLPTSVNEFEAIPHRLPTGQTTLDNPSLRLPSQVAPACAKTTMTTNHCNDLTRTWQFYHAVMMAVLFYNGRIWNTEELSN